MKAMKPLVIEKNSFKDRRKTIVDNSIGTKLFPKQITDRPRCSCEEAIERQS